MTSDFVEVARPLAIEAGRRIMEINQSPLERTRKADKSLVTNADHAADQIIRDGLKKHFPSHAVLTEESGLHGDPNAEYVWVVDPLDGTRAFARGIAGFSVMIGLLRRGKPVAGVVMDPWEGHVYDAEEGHGAFHMLNGQRTTIRVSDRQDWKTMPLVTSTGFPDAITAKVKEKLPCPWLPAINSVGIKVGLLVRQVADIYLNHHTVHYWDTVAPQIILEEAGGVFTLSDGKPLTYNLSSNLRHPTPTLSSNGRKHGELVEMLSHVF
jgi:3'(2'),5'-bisphosphate nucleotidase